MSDLSGLGPDLRVCCGDDDTAVLRHCLDLDLMPGWALEFGVGAGGTARLIAGRLPLLGFDSFDGLPEDWRPGFARGTFAQGVVPVIEGATIVVGAFDDVLPSFDWPEQVALIHFDADLYSSTATALEYCGHLIEAGTVVVFDEYHSYDGSEAHEQKAWEEWAFEHSSLYQAIGHGREQVAFKVLGFPRLAGDRIADLKVMTHAEGVEDE